MKRRDKLARKATFKSELILYVPDLPKQKLTVTASRRVASIKLEDDMKGFMLDAEEASELGHFLIGLSFFLECPSL